jgi:hypothetical protein
MAKLFLKHGAEPNLPRTSKKSSYSLEIDRSRLPLVITISRDHIIVIELLLASGANPVWESTNAGWLDTYSSGQRQEHRLADIRQMIILKETDGALIRNRKRSRENYQNPSPGWSGC